MRYYPFCNSNGGAGSTCQETDYDVVFSPEIITKDDQLIGSHYYDENNPKSVVSYNTLNYFPFDEINVNNSCFVDGATQPLINDPFYEYDAGFGQSYIQKIYPAPYTLLNVPLFQWRSKLIAGFELNGIDEMKYMGGIKHDYFIDKEIDLSEINSEEKIIFNPSEVYIDPNSGNTSGTATPIEIRFPTDYTFKTILGRYPSVEECEFANLDPQNGDYKSDLRDVLVPVNASELLPLSPTPNPLDYPELMSDDINTIDPDNYLLDERYGYYIINRDASIKVEQCVNIYDARFEVKDGGTLEFNDYPSILGYEDDYLNQGRYKIRANGGAVLRNYKNIQYLQSGNIIQNRQLDYVSISSIIAGNSVDPNTDQLSGDYIINSNANVSLTSGNQIVLRPGFLANSGSNLIASINSSLPVPDICRNSSFASNPNSRSKKIINSFPHIFVNVYPNPTQDFLNVTSSNGDIEAISVTNSLTESIFNFETINTNYFSVDLRGYSKGIYFVNITMQDGKSKTFKVVLF
jgi:hypothetical protein